MKNISRALLAVGLCTALCAVACAQPPGGAKKEEGGTQLKTFEVKNANLAEVQQYLTRHFTPAASTPTSKPGPGTTPAPAPAAPAPTIRVTVEPKLKALFVRGPAAEVDKAGQIVAVLDGTTDKGPVHVIALQHVPAEDAMKSLTALNLAKGVTPLPQSRLLVLAQGDPVIEQVKLVIGGLEPLFAPEPKTEVKKPEPKPEPKPEEKKPEVKKPETKPEEKKPGPGGK
jgi:hypothetical protein